MAISEIWIRLVAKTIALGGVATGNIKAKEQDIIDMNNSMQSYQLSKVGPDGELTRKQAQLEYELVEKFKSAVNSVAISGGYDLIIDGSLASLYTKPTHDLTDDVLYELRKASDNSAK